MRNTYRPGHCLTCKADTEIQLTKYVIQNGNLVYTTVCSVCNVRNPERSKEPFISHETIKSIYTPEQIEALPVIYSSGPAVRCVVCGSREAEEHHWFPQGIDETQAKRFPKDYLCQQCHDLWHSKVTPYLVRQKL